MMQHLMYKRMQHSVSYRPCILTGQVGVQDSINESQFLTWPPATTRPQNEGNAKTVEGLNRGRKDEISAF